MNRESKIIVAVIVLLLLIVSVYIGWTTSCKNEMEWPFILLLLAVVVGLPLLLTIGIFSVYRKSYIARNPSSAQHVDWNNYTLQMAFLITVMVIITTGIIYQDSNSSCYFAAVRKANGCRFYPSISNGEINLCDNDLKPSWNMRPSLAMGRGSMALFFSIGADSVAVRFPTAMFWWAYLGAFISTVGLVMRRFVIGHLVPRSYLDSALRFIYAIIATAAFYIAFQVWPELFTQSNSDLINKKYLLMLFALFAGMFPKTIIDWITRRLRKYLDMGGQISLPLSEVQGIDSEMTTFLYEEGIWSLTDIATRDPALLAESIHVDDKLVSNWNKQAKLLIELGDRKTIEYFRKLGINDWDDLAVLSDTDVVIGLDDLIKLPDESNEISPVLIKVLKQKFKNSEVPPAPV